MEIISAVKKIKIEGHRSSRTISCPYCRKVQKVTLVNHLKRNHPDEWSAWGDEFVRLYNKTNDLKRVMRNFTNSEGQLILSWSAIDSEIKRKTAVNGTPPKFIGKSKISRWDPTPDEYQRFRTTVWDVPVRGSWGVHQSSYRGNWAPQIPRALIELYTKPGDLILDPFVGGGTTLIEAWPLGRNALGYDISETALAMTNARLRELEQKAGRESLLGLPRVKVEIRKGDARKLKGLKQGSIDFICAHPPYGDALRYTHDDRDDLSLISDPTRFGDELEVAGRRFFDVLKPGGFCAVLIGDMRRDGVLHTLGVDLFLRFRKIGFSIQDLIVKTQNQDRSTEFFFKAETFRLRLAHEYLFVFQKSFYEGPSKS